MAVFRFVTPVTNVRDIRCIYRESSSDSRRTGETLHTSIFSRVLLTLQYIHKLEMVFFLVVYALPIIACESESLTYSVFTQNATCLT